MDFLDVAQNLPASYLLNKESPGDTSFLGSLNEFKAGCRLVSQIGPPSSDTLDSLATLPLLFPALAAGKGLTDKAVVFIADLMDDSLSIGAIAKPITVLAMFYLYIAEDPLSPAKSLASALLPEKKHVHFSAPVVTQVFYGEPRDAFSRVACPGGSNNLPIPYWLNHDLNGNIVS